MPPGALFIESIVTDPLWFFSVVFTVVVSIVLHELAHGAAAIWQGDETPIVTGHLTANPLVHMGPFSILLLLTVGMAFGLMPVNPSRFRSRHGEALVAAAGPACNLLLAAVALLALGMWMRFAGFWDSSTLSPLASNAQRLMWFFGTTNIGLALLNLLPIPPLDGSTILADYHAGYRRWVQNARDPRMFMFALLGMLVVFSFTDFGLWDIARRGGLWYVNAVSGLTLTFTD